MSFDINFIMKFNHCAFAEKITYYAYKSNSSDRSDRIDVIWQISIAGSVHNASYYPEDAKKFIKNGTWVQIPNTFDDMVFDDYVEYNGDSDPHWTNGKLYKIEDIDHEDKELKLKNNLSNDAHWYAPLDFIYHKKDYVELFLDASKQPETQPTNTMTNTDKEILKFCRNDKFKHNNLIYHVEKIENNSDRVYVWWDAEEGTDYDINVVKGFLEDGTWTQVPYNLNDMSIGDYAENTETTSSFLWKLNKMYKIEGIDLSSDEPICVQNEKSESAWQWDTDWKFHKKAYVEFFAKENTESQQLSTNAAPMVSTSVTDDTTTFENMKFRVKDQEHSKLIQEHLLARGYKRITPHQEIYHNDSLKYLYTNLNRNMMWGETEDHFNNLGYKECELVAHITYSIEPVKKELVEILGKQYNKSDVEELLKTLEEVK